MEAHTPTQPAQEAEDKSEPIVEPATIPAAVRKLADHFTSELPSVIHGRTRSSGGVDSRARSEEIDRGPSAFSGIYWKDERNSIALGAMTYAYCKRSENHARQYKRKPGTLSQCRRHLRCRRASRVFSLKSHQPFAKPKRVPSGRIGRER